MSKKISELLFLSAVIILISGCAFPEYKWVKDGATDSEFEADVAACKRIAESLPRAGDGQLSVYFLDCMVSRSWYRKKIG